MKICQKISFFYLCLFVAMMFLGPIRNSLAKDGATLFKNATPYIFQVKTSQSSDAPKNSYGSGFVVEKNGYLITNYHVISRKIHDEDNNYQIYVVGENENYLAEIISFDVVHDVALIKIDKKFSGSLIMKKDGASEGDSIFSLGLPEDLKMSIVKGIYNGIVKDSYYERIFMTNPINSGMSGGPTINSKGEVIGINVSVLLNALNITFSVPIIYGQKLLNNFLKKKEKYKPIDYYLTIANQLYDVQDLLVSDLIKKRKEEYKKLGNWNFSNYPKTLKCWGKNRTSNRKQYRTMKHVCYFKHGISLGGGSYSGTFQIGHRVVKNINLNKLQFFQKIQNQYDKWGRLLNFFLDLYSNDDISKYSCEMKTITNSHGISFRMNYCLSAMIKYSRIFKFHFRGVTLNTEKSVFIFNGVFSGLSVENAIKILKHQIEHIKLNVSKDE